MVASRFHSKWAMSHIHSNALNYFSLFLFLALCASSTVASAQVAYVQECGATGSSVTSLSCTLSGVGAGHALLIGVYNGEGTLTSVTASTGTPASVISNYGILDNGVMSAYILSNTASGSITITANFSVSNGAPWMGVAEYSNVAASPLDTSADGATAGDVTTENSANLTTTASGDMLWSLCYSQGGTQSVGTAPITWTAIPISIGTNAFFEDGLAGSAGTYYGQCTVNASDTNIITVAIKGSSTVAATPTFSPAAGTYASAQTVTISDSTSGSTIYYTTNGTTPTTSSSVYSSAINVSATETLEAIATASGYSQSAVGSAAYTINGPAATPTFSPAAGAYGPAQTVTISDATSGATIYYTTNGTTPSTSSSVYSSAITVSATETLEAIATAPLYMTSGVGSAAYTINGAVATPTFSPAAGTYSSAQTVTISDGTSGATIYYTTNGTTPTTASTTYSSAITVSATETLEAIATKANYSNSAVGSAAYTISTASIHTVQDNNGYSANGTSVAVAFGSNVTSGDVVLVAVSTYDAETISAPTDTQGNSFTQLVTAGTSGAAVAAIYAATAKSTAADTVTCNISSTNNIHCHIYEVSGVTATVDKTGTSSQAGTALTVSTSASTSNANDYVFAYFADNHTASTYTVGSGYGDTQASEDTSGGDSGFSEDKVVTATGTQTATATASTTDTFVNLIVTLEASGSQPQVATPTFSPAAGAYGPAQTVTISDSTSGSTIYYTTNGTTPTTSSSTYSSAITVSATETLEAIATHSGDVTSAVGSAAYTINGAAATPTFSPAAGAYGPAQSVTISDGTSGATIYYTTNGTTPTTSSSVYSSAISVSATETLEAIATKSGYSNSAVGSAAYTINGAAATPTFSPAAGTYSSAQTVTISDSTSGSTIYYTTNGTTPTTSSTVYSSAITVSVTETLEAIATKTGYTNSAVGSAAYTISSSSVAIKTVQHNSGGNPTATSVAVAFNNNVTSGNILLVAESTYDGETLDTPTDTQGNSFIQLVTAAGSSPDSVAAIYAATAKSSGADTVTCNISASNNIHCHIYEVQGAKAVVDQTGNSTLSSTALTVSTSAATANAVDYVLAFFSSPWCK